MRCSATDLSLAQIPAAVTVAAVTVAAVTVAAAAMAAAAAAAMAEEGVMAPVLGWNATTEAGVAATGVAAIATLIMTGAATEEEEGTEAGLPREEDTTTGVPGAAAADPLLGREIGHVMPPQLSFACCVVCAQQQACVHALALGTCARCWFACVLRDTGMRGHQAPAAMPWCSPPRGSASSAERPSPAAAVRLMVDAVCVPLRALEKESRPLAPALGAPCHHPTVPRLRLRHVAHSAGDYGGPRGPPPPRDGDWTCSSCGANVFASKTEVGVVFCVSVAVVVGCLCGRAGCGVRPELLKDSGGRVGCGCQRRHPRVKC